MGFFLRLVTGNDPFERCKGYALKYGEKLYQDNYQLTFHDQGEKVVSISVLLGSTNVEIKDSKGDFFTVTKSRQPVGKGYYYGLSTSDLGVPWSGTILPGTKLIKPVKMKTISKEEAESLIEPWVRLLEKHYG